MHLCTFFQTIMFDFENYFYLESGSNCDYDFILVSGDGANSEKGT